MQSTLTNKQIQAIQNFLRGRHIPAGVGNRLESCSIASINLALTGTLTDAIPDCMSLVIGKAIIRLQDSMPNMMRNSLRWKQLLPSAAGTGREKEHVRLAILLDWMWTVVLPLLQDTANTGGFGSQWMSMLSDKTEAAAEAVSSALIKGSARTYALSYVARRAAEAVDAFVINRSRPTDARVAEASDAIARVATEATDTYGNTHSEAIYWNLIDPCKLLEKLISC